MTTTPNPILADCLRRAADRLEEGAPYQWGHFGQCNCGHLAQAITGLTASQVHERTFTKLTEWSEIPEAYCPRTGLQAEYAIDALLEIGLTREDVKALENLNSPTVLAHPHLVNRKLRRNCREDVVAYMRAWAELLDSTKALRDAIDCLPAIPQPHSCRSLLNL